MRVLGLCVLMTVLGCGDECETPAVVPDVGADLFIDVGPGAATYDVAVQSGPDTAMLRVTVTGAAAVCEGTCLDEANALQFYAPFPQLEWDGSTFVLRVLTARQATGPVQFDLTVQRDGAVAFAGSFEPAYETTEPSGPGCGEYTYAAVDVEVP